MKLVLIENDLWSLINPGEAKPDPSDLVATKPFFSREDFTTATVKRRLLAEAERRLSNLPKDVGAMVVNASSKPIETEKQFKAKVVCFKCGGKGHYARECRKKGKNEQRPKRFDQTKGVNMSAMCNTLFGATAETWIIDSGATHHMTPKRDYFTCLKECPSNMSSTTVANGSSIEACGIGTVSANIVGHKGDASNLVTHNTLYVPDMRHSVLSVLQMIENGRKVVFNKSGCHIMDMKATSSECISNKVTFDSSPFEFGFTDLSWNMDKYLTANSSYVYKARLVSCPQFIWCAFTIVIVENSVSDIGCGETKLNQNLRFNIKDYTTLRKDRPGKFGGLAVLIKTLEIKFKEIAYNQSKPRESTTDAQAIEIYLTDKTISIINVYHHDNTSINTGLIETLSEASSDIAIILGDFNAERPTWGSPVQDNNVSRAFPQTVIKEFPRGTANEEKFKIKILEYNTKMRNSREVFHEAVRRQEQFTTGCEVYFRNYATGPKRCEGVVYKRHINQLRPVRKKQVETRNLILPRTSGEKPDSTIHQDSNGLLQRVDRIHTDSYRESTGFTPILTESRQDTLQSDRKTREIDANRENGQATPVPEIEPIRTLAEILLQLTAVLAQVGSTQHAEVFIPPFEGTNAAHQFFQVYDRKMDEALVKRTLLDIYPESKEASFAKYFALKLAGQASLDSTTEGRQLGMQLGLPQEVIFEMLTEGLSLSDQRLVRVVPPESLGEWYQTGATDPGNQRTNFASPRGTTAQTCRTHTPAHQEEQVRGLHLHCRRTANSAAPITGTLSAATNQIQTRARGQCAPPNIHHKPNPDKPHETPQPFANQSIPPNCYKGIPRGTANEEKFKIKILEYNTKMRNSREVFHEAVRRQEQFTTGCEVYFRNYATGPKRCEGVVYKRHINQLRPVRKKQVETRNLILPRTSGEKPVKRTLLDIYPESKEASFAKYFALKLAGQASLDSTTEGRQLGMQLGLPQEVIFEMLTEGLSLSDQRLVRVVPPESLGEWYQLVQRIRGTSAPTSRHHEEQPPKHVGPIHQHTKKNSAATNQIQTRARGQCAPPNIHHKPNPDKPHETPQPFANQETKLNQNLRFNIKDYTTLRKDRPGKFGGLAVLIKTLEIKFKEIAYNQSKPRESTTDAQAIEIYLTDKTISIINVYHHDNTSINTGLIETLSEASSDIAIILGDFNAERPTWGSPVQDNNVSSCEGVVYKRHINQLRPVRKKQVETRNLILPRTSGEKPDSTIHQDSNGLLQRVDRIHTDSYRESTGFTPILTESRQDTLQSDRKTREIDANRENGQATPVPEIEPIRTLAEILLQLTAVLAQVGSTQHAEVFIPPFEGTNAAHQFFQVYDRKMDEALVKRTLLDIYPESKEASFAKYFALKLAGQASLDSTTEGRQLGMQLGLPQEVIFEMLTEGLSLSDQRLVRVVPPESLGEWYQLVQRIRGTSAPTSRHHEEQPPKHVGPIHQHTKKNRTKTTTGYLQHFDKISNTPNSFFKRYRENVSPSSDSDDFNPLTPGHFLIGRPLTALPESNDDDVPINYLDRWSLNQKIKNVFWKRWNREYLNNLQQRLKWQKSSLNIKEGDLILLKDTISAPAMYWSLGRITKVFPGADGKIRVFEWTVSQRRHARTSCTSHRAGHHRPHRQLLRHEDLLPSARTGRQDPSRNPGIAPPTSTDDVPWQPPQKVITSPHRKRLHKTHQRHHPSDFTTATVKRRLLAEAERRSSNLPKYVGAMVVNASSKPIETEKQFKAKVVCFKCGGKGHYAKECRKKGKNEQRPKRFDQKKGVNMSAMCNTLFGATAETWIIDSGATHHMTPKRDNFTCLKECTSNMSSINIANGSSIEACGIGTVSANIVGHKGDASNMVAQNTLYVPDLRHSVLSVLQIWNIQGVLGNHIAGISLVSNNIDTDSTDIVGHKGDASNMVAQNTLYVPDLRHSVLGNHIAGISLVSNNIGTVSANIVGHKGDASNMVAQNTLYVPDLRHSVLSVLQMIENGRKVVFNKSGCHIMDMKDQNDHVSLASECKEELTLELWHKRLMHVNAYTIAKMAKNQSNGVAERMNRTLLDLVRSTISGSGLPKASWAELTYTAAYVRNRVLNNHNGESTPYELWTGNKPSLKHLRAIGCQVFVHIPRQVRKSKLERRAVKGNLVGYALRGRGYRVWIPEMKKVVESRDCVFKKSDVSRNDSNREELPSVEHYSYGTQREIEDNPVSLLDQEDVTPTEEDSHNEDTVKPSPTRSHPMILRNQRNAQNSIELLSTEANKGRNLHKLHRSRLLSGEVIHE
ncbi:hypothetical protein LAZ67_1003529 [Cordylochernes scorpioides]|uniref:CCHC-type domain-containing protein n=1 Tax=Cordylochernes scorpioides TaxID=51811 RepID=A0ABY6JZV8_9ARAC|nr:hypothetical protein LAZ67_1003529 [Cordylochernes scorpioides]